MSWRKFEVYRKETDEVWQYCSTESEAQLFAGGYAEDWEDRESISGEHTFSYRPVLNE